MSLEDDLAEVDKGYAKMDLKSPLHVCTGEWICDDQVTEIGGQWINKADLLALLLETYQTALEIGWETKALDAMTTKIREAQ